MPEVDGEVDVSSSEVDGEVDVSSSERGAGGVVVVSTVADDVESPSAVTTDSVVVSDPAVVDALSEVAEVAVVAEVVVVVVTTVEDAEVEGGGGGGAADASKEFIDGKMVFRVAGGEVETLETNEFYDDRCECR